jgi:hypothetical protein
LRNTALEVWLGCTPIPKGLTFKKKKKEKKKGTLPSLVTMAEVLGFTRNSSAAYLTTAVNGVFSGTFLSEERWIKARR